MGKPSTARLQSRTSHLKAFLCVRICVYLMGFCAYLSSDLAPNLSPHSTHATYVASSNESLVELAKVGSCDGDRGSTVESSVALERFPDGCFDPVATGNCISNLHCLQNMQNSLAKDCLHRLR